MGQITHLILCWCSFIALLSYIQALPLTGFTPLSSESALAFDFHTKVLKHLTNLLICPHNAKEQTCGMLRKIKGWFQTLLKCLSTFWQIQAGLVRTCLDMEQTPESGHGYTLGFRQCFWIQIHGEGFRHALCEVMEVLQGHEMSPKHIRQRKGHKSPSAWFLGLNNASRYLWLSARIKQKRGKDLNFGY